MKSYIFIWIYKFEICIGFDPRHLKSQLKGTKNLPNSTFNFQPDVDIPYDTVYALLEVTTICVVSELIVRSINCINHYSIHYLMPAVKLVKEKMRYWNSSRTPCLKTSRDQVLHRRAENKVFYTIFCPRVTTYHTRWTSTLISPSSVPPITMETGISNMNSRRHTLGQPT